MSDIINAAIAAALAVTSASLFTDDRPPERYQRNATFTIELKDQSGIDRTCQPLFGTPPKGMKTDACATGERVILPNPCAYDQEVYARMLCHELGHVNGWPSSHE